MQDVDFDKQMQLNIDQKRLDKKVRILEMQAKERKKKMKRMPKKIRDGIKDRAEQMLKQYGLE